MAQKDRGCVFFNFGTTYIIRLFVALYSLRDVYDGPVTLMLNKSPEHEKLSKEMAQFNVDIQWFDVPSINRFVLKPNLFRISPYKTTLMFDADLLFIRSFDELWQPLEEKGVLITKSFPNPYGIAGTPENRGWGDRVKRLENTRPLLTDKEFRISRKRLLIDKIDVNIEVMGYYRGSPRWDSN